MDDVDVNSKMTREKMEELSSALLDRMMEPVKKAMSEAGMIPADVKAVELVGNAARMPFISSQLARIETELAAGRCRCRVA